MSELDGRVIRGVDLTSPSFRRAFARIKIESVRREALTTIKTLLLANIDQLPARLHLHQLTNKTVPSVLDPKKKVAAWSLHVTADDAYKASFTYEDGAFYFRLLDEHDVIDKNP